MVRHDYTCEHCNKSQEWYCSVHESPPPAMWCPDCNDWAPKVWGCNVHTMEPINREELVGQKGPDVTSKFERDQLLAANNLTLDKASNLRIPRTKWEDKIDPAKIKHEMSKRRRDGD